MDEADILEAAAEILETEGWVKGNFYRDPALWGRSNSGYCAVGSIRQAVGVLYSNDVKLDEQAEGAVMALRNHIQDDVPVWNDQPNRTKFEVIDTLKTVAKDIRNGRS